MSTEAVIKWGMTPKELSSVAENTPVPLIDGLLPSSAVVTFAGEPGVGKSFTALSWAASVANGTDWFSQKVSGPARVAYILGEGWARFGHRVQAWEKVNGSAIDESNMRFINGAADGIDLTDASSVETLIENLRDYAPALVVLDTFAMLARVRNENDNSEVGNVFAVAHRIVQTIGATVVLIHHVSKSEGQVRGATAFRGNADTVIVANPAKDSSNTFTLSTHGSDDGKQRDGEAVRLHGFTISSPGVIGYVSEQQRVESARASMRANRVPAEAGYATEYPPGVPAVPAGIRRPVDRASA